MRRMGTQCGLTLIEMVLTIVILAISLIAISSILSSGVGRSADTTVELRSSALAYSYLNEILGKRFDENSHPRGIPPCRNGNCTAFGNFGSEGETRAQYDDVDDYNGLDEGEGLSFPLRHANGEPRLGYDNFRVRVSVRYMNKAVNGTEENLAVATNDLDDNEDAKVITVTVNFLNGGTEGVSYSAYKTNY